MLLNLENLEPVVGFEPTTDGLQNRCSTTELNWRDHPLQTSTLIVADLRRVKVQPVAPPLVLSRCSLDLASVENGDIPEHRYQMTVRSYGQFAGERFFLIFEFVKPDLD